MKEIIQGLGIMYTISVIAMIAVIVAMAVDLISGIRKAKIRGEARTSYGFSRSLTKFLIYQGILLIATCIDTLLHFGLYNIIDTTYIVPCTELLMAIILCGVELWSVYEKAETKERRKMAQIAQAGAQILDKEVLAAAIAEVLKNYLTKKGNNAIVDDNINFE